MNDVQIYFADIIAFFKQWNKFRGRKEAARGVPPPYQRFGAEKSVVCVICLRLKPHFEFFVANCRFGVL